MGKMLLKNGLVMTPSGLQKLDVFVQDGKISALAQGESGAEVIDCTGLHVLPGVIDMHVHCREPGLTLKEDFESASRAAAAGGVTTMFDMPNTLPPTVSVQALEEKRELASRHAIVNIGLYAGLTNTNVSEIQRMEHIVGVKVFLAKSTGGLVVTDMNELEKLFAWGKLPVVVHAEDERCVEKYQAACADLSRTDRHSLARPTECAFDAVRRVLHLAKKYEARVHITHVTSAEELEEIRKFKTDKVTCDVTPHHLFLDVHAYDEQGNRVKVNPPLRSREDREALWGALDEGLIDMIGTDHAPHLLEEKDAERYEDVPAGVPGLETMLPLLLESVNRGRLTLERVVEMVSARPAQVFGQTGKGRIEVGADADITVVDMRMEKEVRNEDLLTKCKWSPFAGMKLHGWPVLTIVGGKVVWKMA